MSAGADPENEAAALLGPAAMKEYRDDCAAALGALEAAVAAGGDGVLETARLTAHRLSGSAGTYGYPEASAVAAGLERRVLDAKNGSPAPDAADLRAALAALRRALRLPG